MTSFGDALELTKLVMAAFFSVDLSLVSYSADIEESSGFSFPPLALVLAENTPRLTSESCDRDVGNMIPF